MHVCRERSRGSARNGRVSLRALSHLTFELSVNQHLVQLTGTMSEVTTSRQGSSLVHTGRQWMPQLEWVVSLVDPLGHQFSWLVSSRLSLLTTVV